jgi:pimeloyl-ACP methyl ester carboxylesterase
VSERRLVNDEIVRAPTPARRRRRLIVIALYVFAMTASTWMRVRAPVPEADPGEQRVTVTRADGQGVTIAFDRHCPVAAVTTAAPVVLLHGSPGTRHDFDGLMPALVPDRCVIAPDLPGFGHSTRGVADYSVDAHAADVLALLDRLGVPAAHVVGFSMGGGVAIAMTARAPARIRSLTLVSGLGIQEQELFGRYWVNHVAHGIQLAFLWLAIEATPHGGAFDGAFMGVEYARNFYDTDQRPLRPALLAFDGPALVYHGRHDFLVPPDAAIEHHRLLPQSRLVMGDGDHFDTFMRPGEVAAAIRPFLADADAGRALTRVQASAASRAEAFRPYAGAIGSPHMGPLLMIEVGVPIVGMLGVGLALWRRRRRRRRRQAYS